MIAKPRVRGDLSELSRAVRTRRLWRIADIEQDAPQTLDVFASHATATTDSLEADILNKCGRAVPPRIHALRRTLAPIGVLMEM